LATHATTRAEPDTPEEDPVGEKANARLLQRFAYNLQNAVGVTYHPWNPPDKATSSALPSVPSMGEALQAPVTIPGIHSDQPIAPTAEGQQHLFSAKQKVEEQHRTIAP
jgi:hypothetical protein